MAQKHGRALLIMVASALLFAVSQKRGFVELKGASGRPQQPASSSLRGALPAASLGAAAGGLAPAAYQPHSTLLATLAATAALVIAVAVCAPKPASAFFGTGNAGEIVGELEASGLVFKDTINVERITDPKVSGVTLYQTDFSKSSFDKLTSGNLLQSDPGAAGLACTVDGKVLAKPDISKDKKGEEIFSEAKKTLWARRSR